MLQIYNAIINGAMLYHNFKTRYTRYRDLYYNFNTIALSNLRCFEIQTFYGIFLFHVKWTKQSGRPFFLKTELRNLKILYCATNNLQHI
jgi:hypothetical protein